MYTLSFSANLPIHWTISLQYEAPSDVVRMQKARLIAAQWLELRPVALVFERPCRRRLQSAPCLQLQAAYVCLFVYTHHCTIRLLILLVLRSPTHEEETQRWGCHSIPQMLKTIFKRVSIRTVSAPYRLLLLVTTDLVVKQYERIGYGVAISFYANREGYRKCFPTAFSDKHHSIPEFLQSYILERYAEGIKAKLLLSHQFER